MTFEIGNGFLRLRVFVFELDKSVKNGAQLTVFWLVNEPVAEALPEKVRQVSRTELIIAQVVETVFEFSRADLTEAFVFVRLVIDFDARQFTAVQKENEQIAQ